MGDLLSLLESASKVQYRNFNLRTSLVDDDVICQPASAQDLNDSVEIVRKFMSFILELGNTQRHLSKVIKYISTYTHIYIYIHYILDTNICIYTYTYLWPSKKPSHLFFFGSRAKKCTSSRSTAQLLYASKRHSWFDFEDGMVNFTWMVRWEE